MNLISTMKKKDIFGVVVVLEDAVVSRKKVYDKVFLELEELPIWMTRKKDTYIVILKFFR